MIKYNRPLGTFTYYPLLAILLITAQLAATCLGPRIIEIGSFKFPGGILSFPLTFFLLDIITEVYGFNRARQIIFYYLLGQLFFALLISLGLSMPAAPFLHTQTAYHEVLGNVNRLTLSMITAIVLGDYVNCYVLAKIKYYTNEYYLWMRLIGATALGELVTSIIWVVLFYVHDKIHPDFIKFILCQYIIKILFEVICIFPTYVIVGCLKRVEGVERYKRYSNFDPLTIMPFYRENKEI